MKPQDLFYNRVEIWQVVEFIHCWGGHGHQQKLSGLGLYIGRLCEYKIAQVVALDVVSCPATIKVGTSDLITTIKSVSQMQGTTSMHEKPLLRRSSSILVVDQLLYWLSSKVRVDHPHLTLICQSWNFQ